MSHTNITLYGTTWCGDCKRAKQFFGEQRVHYDFIDVDANPEAMAYVEKVNNGKQSIPVIVFDDGSTLTEPSNAELAEKLGLQTMAKRRYYDLIVVGSGPAGLTAALYAAREGLDTLVIERGGVGGQAAITEVLDNFPGFPEGVSGAEFADRLRAQAERFGVEILSAQEVTEVHVDGRFKCVKTGDGEEYRAGAVLLALGSKYRRLGIPGEDDFIGAGVHFCATCDGAFYRGKKVLVIGGGNSAAEEGVFLTRFADHVTILTRDAELSASKVARQKVSENKQIDVITGVMPVEVRGNGRLKSVVVQDVKTGETRDIEVGGLFVAIGHTPNTSLFDGQLELSGGYIVVEEPSTQASVEGVFAAGDVVDFSYRQAITAAGMGCKAAMDAERFLEAQGH